MKRLLMIILLAIVLAGCTKYTVEKYNPDGSPSTIVSVWSTRSFEQPDLHYAREGENAEFDFKAAGVDNNTDAIVGMFAPIVQGIMSGRIILAQPIPPQ